MEVRNKINSISLFSLLDTNAQKLFVLNYNCIFFSIVAMFTDLYNFLLRRIFYSII